MICPMCNGSGKCYEQKIRYQEIETNRTDFTIAQCHKCNGTGEVQMTNEEWLRTATTEQLAKALMKIFITRTFCHLCPEGDVCDIGHKCKYSGGGKIEDWLKWLKQPHKEE